MGKNSNSWKVINDEGYAFVKFNVDVDKDEVLQSYNSNLNGEEYSIGTIDVVGTVSINNYNNILTPQIIIKDYVFNKGWLIG